VDIKWNGSILTKYLKLFWSAIFINEYKLEFQFKKVRKMRNSGNVYVRGLLFAMSKTNVENRLYSIFKASSLTERINFTHACIVWLNWAKFTTACLYTYISALI
jgi:hypothetical protein